MGRLLDRFGFRSITSINDYVNTVNEYGFGSALETTWGPSRSEPLRNSFGAFAQGGFAGNGIVFSCMVSRQLVFSATRFRWQRIDNGKPSELFGTPALGLLERPAPGETTQDLLNRMIQDADLAGNAYHIKDTPLARMGGDGSTHLVRLRPDWVEIVAAKRMRPDGQIGWVRVGYIYTEGGKHSGNDPVPLLLDEVSHFSPIPDPLANFRGMSWLTPVVREIENDSLMTQHKRRFFQNGATPNMIIKHPAGADRQKVLDFQRRLEAENAGVYNAYKTLNLYPGADATVVGTNLRQLDFKQVQGAGETRIAAAAGVPPIIVGLSEGLEAATYSNYGQARRRFADGTIHPLWQNAAASLEPMLASPGSGVRLWYDSDNIPFLREDEGDAAAIQATRAGTISTLISAGYTPDSVVRAIEADDFRLLEHTGLFSVQLQAPGTNPTPPNGGGTTP